MTEVRTESTQMAAKKTLRSAKWGGKFIGIGGAIAIPIYTLVVLNFFLNNATLDLFMTDNAAIVLSIATIFCNLAALKYRQLAQDKIARAEADVATPSYVPPPAGPVIIGPEQIEIKPRPVARPIRIFGLIIAIVIGLIVFNEVLRYFSSL